MRTFLRDLLATFWFALKIGLGILIVVGLLRLLNTPFWVEFQLREAEAVPFMANLETAVTVVGVLFAGTWSLRLLDKILFRGGLINRFGLRAGSGFNPFTLFTYPLVHRDETHLFSNTRKLLIFAGVAVLMLPSLSLFAIATVVILVINALGLFLFSRGVHAIGASGLLLGYFSMLVSYGLVIAGGWQAWTAGIIMLLFSRSIFRNLFTVGHFWGFVGGLLATRAVYMLGG